MKYPSVVRNPLVSIFPVNIYLLINLPFHRHTKKMCEMCSKLTIKTAERRQQRSSVFIFNFKHISYIFLLYLLMTLNK